METSKLYSEILNSLNNNDNWESDGVEFYFQRGTAAKSIEQLVIEKMADFMNWMWNNRKDIYKIEDERTELNNKWQFIKEDGTILYLTEKELIELYLNK